MNPSLSIYQKDFFIYPKGGDFSTNPNDTSFTANLAQQQYH
ncbi:MAG: hypothetical protein AB2421_11065 [Thermotaleaceae bacterium]